MSEQKLSEHNPPSEGRSIEYWRVRWQLVHDSMPSHLKVPKVVLDSGDGLVAALEAKLEAMEQFWTRMDILVHALAVPQWIRNEIAAAQQENQ